MTTEKRHKTLSYRSVRVDGDTRPFEFLLRTALARLKSADSRFHFPANDGRNVRLINAASKVRGVMCGDYLAYERGRAAQLVQHARGVDKLPVNAYQSPSGNEYLGGLLLWAVAGNNVVIIQSATLRSGDFERYLNWLLDQAGLLSNGGGVSLEHKASPTIATKLRGNPVKNVQVKLPLFRAQRVPQQTSKNVDVTFHKTAAADVLRGLIGADELDRLRIDSAAAANIRLDIRVNYNRTTDQAGEAVLRRLAERLTHQDSLESDEVTYEVEGVGTVIRGSELRLEVSVPIPCTDGNVHLHDAFLEMTAYLRELLESDLLE